MQVCMYPFLAVHGPFPVSLSIFSGGAYGRITLP